jgi:hypothetical protein
MDSLDIGYFEYVVLGCSEMVPFSPISHESEQRIGVYVVQVGNDQSSKIVR